MSISKDQALEMQSRVNASNLRSKRGKAKTRAGQGAGLDVSAGAARARPKRVNALGIGSTAQIGIDPGTKTGFCQIGLGKMVSCETLGIFDAIESVRAVHKLYGDGLFVRFEDARLRKWFGKSGPEKWKGAGSIMRDCAIWEETLTSLGISFEMVAPKDVKETTEEHFKKLTGWKGRTSIHAREAAWLILPYLKPKNI